MFVEKDLVLYLEVKQDKLKSSSKMRVLYIFEGGDQVPSEFSPHQAKPLIVHMRWFCFYHFAAGMSLL